MPSQNRRFDVTLVGETNLDLILYGLPEAMPLERELLASDFKMTLGGSSAITAFNLARLGMRVGFVTRTGDDAMGRLALQQLADDGLDVYNTAHRSERLGTGVTLLLPHGSHRRILTYAGLMAEMTVDDVPFDYLADTGHLHLSSLFLQKGLHTGLVSLLRRLRNQGITISLDTNDDPDDLWSGVLHQVLPLVDILLPSEAEILKITGSSSLEQSLRSLDGKVPLVVVKCGSRGALVYEKGRAERVPGLSVMPIDTIGAGDSFNAGFLKSYLQGASPVIAAGRGNLSGALSTQSFGGTEAFRDEALRSAFLESYDVPSTR